jgi:hypothetical protein
MNELITHTASIHTYVNPLSAVVSERIYSRKTPPQEWRAILWFFGGISGQCFGKFAPEYEPTHNAVYLRHTRIMQITRTGLSVRTPD